MFSTTSATVWCAHRVNRRPLADRDDSCSSHIFFESPFAPPPTSTAGPCQPAPDSLRVNIPTHVTSFQTLLKAAVIVDGGPQTRQHLDHIAVENYQIEVNDRFDRDVSEDVAVGACNAAIDGVRREQARQSTLGVPTVGLRTPLWSIVDSHQVANADVLGLAGEIPGF